MKLYAYRNSQCRGLQDAWEDGVVRYLGTFGPNTLELAQAKAMALVVAEMIDPNEELVFIEVSDPDRVI